MDIYIIFLYVCVCICTSTNLNLFKSYIRTAFFTKFFPLVVLKCAQIYVLEKLSFLDMKTIWNTEWLNGFQFFFILDFLVWGVEKVCFGRLNGSSFIKWISVWKKSLKSKLFCVLFWNKSVYDLEDLRVLYAHANTLSWTTIYFDASLCVDNF